MRLTVVGGGILGLATARLAAREVPGTEVVVLEREAAVGRHQTGHNSGVVHAGLYYEPGSLKARLCRRGEWTSFPPSPGSGPGRSMPRAGLVDDFRIARSDGVAWVRTRPRRREAQ